MNEFLAIAKIAQNATKRLEEQNIKIIGITFEANRPCVQILSCNADKLVNAKPVHLHNVGDIENAIMDKRIHIRATMNGVNIDSIVWQYDFPKLFDKYIAMAREQLQEKAQ